MSYHPSPRSGNISLCFVIRGNSGRGGDADADADAADDAKTMRGRRGVVIRLDLGTARAISDKKGLGGN